MHCIIYIFFNRPFPSCFEPHCKSEAKCNVFITKIMNIYANIIYASKSFALSLAFVMRFTATRKWPIDLSFTKTLKLAMG